MKITVIYATERKEASTTYNLTQIAIYKLKEEDDVYEFFLPKDMNHFCKGCYMCFEGKFENCGGYNKIKVIKDAMDKSDLVIFTAPVYVFHIPGQMKSFLDHFGYQWMVHQPNGKMFSKQALVISIAAGAGMRSTVKDIKHSLDYWGIGKFYSYKKAVLSGSWDDVDNEKKNKCIRDIDKVVEKIINNRENLKPRMKVKFLFYLCRFMQRKIGTSHTDKMYWRDKGWLDNKRPW